MPMCVCLLISGVKRELLAQLMLLGFDFIINKTRVHLTAYSPYWQIRTGYPSRCYMVLTLYSIYALVRSFIRFGNHNRIFKLIDGNESFEYYFKYEMKEIKKNRTFGYFFEKNSYSRNKNKKTI
jgi:hypothetical protein